VLRLFIREGVNVLAHVGQAVSGVEIEDTARIGTLKQREISLAIVAVPRGAAQTTVDSLVAAGVKGILNFAPCKLRAPRRVKVITLDIAMELARLPYYMPRAEQVAET